MQNESSGHLKAKNDLKKAGAYIKQRSPFVVLNQPKFTPFFFAKESV